MVEITYICKRTVVSTKPVQPGKYYDLSVFDRLMEKYHLRMVFYYTSSRGKIEEAGEMTKRLRESLAEMLTCFPMVTGRLVKRPETGKWMIKCNDAGVRMVEARAKGSVEDWLRCVDSGMELKLTHWEDMFHNPYFWSTFYVQITEFENGGLTVGLSCTHLLSDLTCVTTFIKAWADITYAHKMSMPPFFHPLPPRRPINRNPNHNPYTSLINHYKSSIHNPTPVTNSKHSTITLAFSHHMVKACMNMAQVPSPSPFEALAGLLWARISKAQGKTNGLVNMSLCLDMRKVLGLDKAFFGNCMIYNTVQSEGLEGNDISQAVCAIQDVVAKMDNEGINDLIEWLKCNEQECHTLMNGCDLICASLEGVDPYLSMFEEGVVPIRISYYVEPVYGVGRVLILPSSRSEGSLSRVVMVTLQEDEMVKLCEDDLISRFSPTILMGVNAKS